MKKQLQEMFKENKVKAVTNVNGHPVVSFAEQRDISGSMLKDELKVEARKFNPDGTVAGSKVSTTAINISEFYNNRYKVEDGKVYLVTAQTTDGYWAIKEQSTGRVPFEMVQTYVFERKDGDLRFIETAMVPDKDFITNFVNKLNADAMKEYLPLIPSGNDMEGTASPI